MTITFLLQRTKRRLLTVTFTPDEIGRVIDLIGGADEAGTRRSDLRLLAKLECACRRGARKDAGETSVRLGRVDIGEGR